MNSKVSVIMPVFNVEKYIAKSIESVLNQTYSNFELLIVDDGSPDKSINVVKKFNDDRIKIIHKSNGGLSDARNYGMIHATGEFTFFIDSDDWIEPNLLEESIKAIKHNNVDFVVFGYSLDAEDINGKLISTTTVVSESLIFIKKIKNIKFERNILNLLGYAWNKLYKTDFLKSNNIIFDKGISLVEDMLFNSKVYINSYKILFINNALYHYIDRPAISLIKKYHENSFELIVLKSIALNDFLKSWNVESDIKNIILAENINQGIRYCINNMFSFKNDLKEFDKIKNIRMMLRHEETLKYISYYNAVSPHDKLYKKIIINEAVLMLYLLCKIKK